MSDERTPPRLILLESEVAKIFRCSTSTVKRLRLSGKLPYVPGRPVRIFKADVYEYLRGLRRSKPIEPELGAPEAARTENEKIAALARRISLTRRLRRQASSS